MAGSLLLNDFENLTFVDADEIAATVLDTAEYYLEIASEKEDLSSYGDEAQLSQAQRLMRLTVARWLKSGVLDRESLRRSLQMRDEWARTKASAEELEADVQESLSEWMAEWMAIDEFRKAAALYEEFCGDEARKKPPRSEAAYVIARGLMELAEDSVARAKAKTVLDRLYRQLTDWTAPGFRGGIEIETEERLLWAYIRGKHFGGEDNPIRLIKRMKFSL